jgi:hypothetical protein
MKQYFALRNAVALQVLENQTEVVAAIVQAGFVLIFWVEIPSISTSQSILG